MFVLAVDCGLLSPVYTVLYSGYIFRVYIYMILSLQ